MDMGRVIAIQPIYANPTQPNPTHNVPVKIQPNPNQPNPTQPNPWVDPTHVHVWCKLLLVLRCNCVFVLYHFWE